jgi:hypothetical protein
MHLDAQRPEMPVAIVKVVQSVVDQKAVNSRASGSNDRTKNTTTEYAYASGRIRASLRTMNSWTSALWISVEAMRNPDSAKNRLMPIAPAVG